METVVIRGGSSQASRAMKSSMARGVKCHRQIVLTCGTSGAVDFARRRCRWSVGRAEKFCLRMQRCAAQHRGDL